MNKEALFFGQFFIDLSFRQTFMTMIFRLSGLLLAACMVAQLHAQDNQYIVKLNGDTIRGELKINPIRDNSNSMSFKAEGGSNNNIRPIRVKYVYYDHEYQFRSVPFYSQRLFMQIIKEYEHISYYNYIRKGNNSILTTKVATKPNGEAVELSGLTFRKQVTEFLDDCPEIVAKLESKKYRYKDYEKLFADYNNCEQPLVLAQGPSSTATEVTAATTIVSTTETAEASIDDTVQEKLTKVDEFGKYVAGLKDFAYANDVLEWLSDVENRIRQNREIPNYLWSSLNAMTEEQTELNEKAEELKKDLEN